LRFASYHPDRCFRLVYEQLVTSPRATLAELMHWLGDELDAGQLAFNQRPHQSGLEDPKIESTSTVHSASIGRWPMLLDVDEAALIWSHTHDLVPLIDPAGWFTTALGDYGRSSGTATTRAGDAS
jgi:hypothetical protein